MHEEQRISGFVHGLKTKSLLEFLSTYLPTTYKGLMEKTYTWIEAKEVATNGAPTHHREGFNRFNKGSSWDNNKGRNKDRDKFSPYKGSNHRLLANLSKSLREILATEKAAKGFKQPPRMVRISGRQVNRAYMDSGSSCEVIYEHCFLKLKPSIKALRVDSKTPLVGFYLRRNILWPPRNSSLEVMEKLKETFPEATEDVLSCVDVEEMVVVNDKYLEQTIIIGKQLSASLKKKLQDL
ncbi:hypothetical protein Tco_0127397 [Tanacetum coccineum]